MTQKVLLFRQRASLPAMMTIALVGGLTLFAQRATTTDPQTAVNNAFNQFKTLKEGKNADYMPALAKVDPNLFGIVLVTADGKVYTAGDVKTEVSIQSISKVFTMAEVVQEQGPASIEKRSKSQSRSWITRRLSRSASPNRAAGSDPVPTS